MATWRRARSLDVLADEVRARHPGTTVWDIGDPAHQETWSDHNPTAAGVVCAIDILGNKGLGLAWFAERVRASKHPALKYVIYNRRISLFGGPWQAYYGSNPHTTHVHVSVGTGPDGRSTGPYDDRSPWGIAPPPPKETTMALTPAQEKILKAGTSRIEALAQGRDTTVTHWATDNTAVEPMWTVQALKRLEQRGAELAAMLAVILGAVQGDRTETILARINEVAAAESARDAELRTLVEQGQSGELDAAEVVRLMGERLMVGATPTGPAGG